MPKPIHPPIVLSTIYEHESSEELRQTMLDNLPYFYIRSGNPTLQAVAEEIAALESGKGALLFASGMAAITCSFLTCLSAGDHVICHEEIFSQTRSLLSTVFERLGITVTFVNVKRRESLTAALKPATRMLYAETPSNPLLDIVSIAESAEFARLNGIPFIVDSTNATPILQQPLELGATAVIHSGTKYMAGHSDVLCGILASNDTEFLSRAYTVQKLTGSILDPHAAYLLHRGLQTLSVRMKQICETAERLARFLQEQEEVSYVRYPLLPQHPDHAIARTQMKGGGGLISFELKSGLAGAKLLLNSLSTIKIATSLGSTHSSIEIPYELKRIRSNNEERMGLIRLAVGLEPFDVLRDDLLQALVAR